MHNYWGFVTPHQNFERTNNSIPRKPLERQMDGWTNVWMDRQTLSGGKQYSSGIVILYVNKL